MAFVMLKEQWVGKSGVGGLKHLEGGRPAPQPLRDASLALSMTTQNMSQ